MPIIQWVDEQAPDCPATTFIVFIGGPLDGVRRAESDPPDVIEANGATYRRSVRCADDGALRYVLQTVGALTNGLDSG
ncbi:MAG: hypothetical protein ACRDGQ_13055 [Candidatus Limnocylindrales bacterium]